MKTATLLNPNTGHIVATLNGSFYLTLIERESIEDGAFIPAKSITLSVGEWKALRSYLDEALEEYSTKYNVQG